MAWPQCVIVRRTRLRSGKAGFDRHGEAFCGGITDRPIVANERPGGCNIDRKAAERIAKEIFDAIHENVATKADIAAIKAELREFELRLDARIDRVVVRLGTPVGANGHSFCRAALLATAWLNL
ncbi:MAG: hypothetical protein JO320_28090 [Alphaproteobacteria bacterium]|nr:hypothetical protein [Alphaproteobacteria bacterium]MBV9378869.1 hypothetical protein [Alphaproteobacteria bacterium]